MRSMRSLLRVLLIVVLGAGIFAGAAGAADLGIITGSEKGTYFQFGLNLQQLLKSKSIGLNVYTSKGSIENVYAVYQRPGVQLGIVQADVLAFISRVDTNPVLQRIAKKTRLVFPLYNEEVHLLGRSDITDFDDLADRRVAIGREGSGTYLTTRLLFKLSEVVPKEVLLIDTDEALAELKAGHIDAMFYVAGFPVKLLTEGVNPADGLNLIPIMNKSILEFYPRTQIPAQTYPWQPKPIDTVAVKSALVSYDYKRGDCDAVGRAAEVVASNLDWLTKNGHPKWKAVDLAAPLKGWEQYECVRKYLKQPGQPAAKASRPSANPVMDAIKDALGE
ncbi:MAG TPA: TAXI family TRAP transporter solute-binding subunit [Candidatus Baltobacteraceae bacterium]|nr:TAXI family TRAP transporter solute-binding subunit [Candidatus Baltobacteraceae bacterium]